jgi:hypothetical protein
MTFHERLNRLSQRQASLLSGFDRKNIDVTTDTLLREINQLLLTAASIDDSIDDVASGEIGPIEKRFDEIEHDLADTAES